MGVSPGQTVYPILDGQTLDRFSQDPISLLKSWKDLSIGWYQFRWKGASDDQYLKQIDLFQKHFPEMGIIVNDRLELFLQNRDRFLGLHVGQTDLEEAPARSIGRLSELSREAGGPVLGVSTHNVEEMERILPARTGGAVTSGFDIRWTYLAMGPFYPTGSKTEGLSPVLAGLKRKEFVDFYYDILLDEKGGESKAPLFTPVLIGGISDTNIRDLLEEFMQNRPRPVLPLPALIQAAHRPETLERILRTIDTYT